MIIYRSGLIVVYIMIMCNVILNAQDLKKDNKINFSSQGSSTVKTLIELSNNSQNHKLDSLWRIYKNAKNDTICIKLLNEKIGYYYENINSDSAILFYNKAIILAENNLKQKNSDKNRLLSFKARSLQYIGLIHAEKGRYDKALEYYFKSLKIDEKLNNKKSMASSYTNIGIVHYHQNSYKKALEYYFIAINVLEEINNKHGIPHCYNNIGNVYMMQRNYPKANEYYKKATKMAEYFKDKKGLSKFYNNVGLVNLHLGNQTRAIEYFLKSLKIKEELFDKNGMALVYINIAFLNISLADSVVLSEKQRLNYLGKAVEYGEKAYKLSKAIGSLPLQNNAAEYLKMAFKKLNKYKETVKYAEIFIATKDSMFKEEKTNAMTEMEAKYQSEKKQLEIDKIAKEKELQTSELKKQRLIILFVVCGLLFVFVFAIVLFRLFILKKKANKIITEKNDALQIAYKEINTQKEEIIVQRDNLQEQKEIIEEHQREIEDSINYAKRIQQAVMPNIKEIKNTKYQLPNTKLQAALELGTFILFRPKDIVSGDFFWSTQIGEMLILTVADCTGHGVPGAFMSMLGISFLNEIVRKKEITKANEVLDILRDSIIDALQQKGHFGEQQDGMDIVICAINVQTLEMQFAGANNPLWIVKKVESYKVEEQTLQTLQTFELYELKGDKQPIGIYENMKPFTNHIYQLHKGDSIYLMSDGYEDQFGGPNRKKFLAKNLKNLLTANSQQPMANQQQILETTLNEWMGNNEQIDDITILGLRI